MGLILYKSIYALLIFLISLGAARYAAKTQREVSASRWLIHSEALASGLFFGLAFFHMLPYAITLFHVYFDTLEYPVPEIILASGFLLLLLLERLYLARTLSPFYNTTIPYFLLLVLVIHALTEGIALGIGQNWMDTVAILIAIAAYKISTSMTLCTTLQRYQNPTRTIIAMMIFFALMTPLGIALGIYVNDFLLSERGRILLASFNAFAAGAFLYLSVMYLIQFHQRLIAAEDDDEPAPRLLEFGFFAVAVIAMAVLALWT